MSARMWMVVVAIAAMMPWLTQAQHRTFDTPQRLDGVVVSVDFEPAAMAPGWADSHRSSGVDTAAPAVRPELDRHLVVAVVDELRENAWATHASRSRSHAQDRPGLRSPGSSS